MLQSLNTKDSRFSGMGVWDICNSIVGYPSTICISQFSKLLTIQMLQMVSGIMSRYL